MALGWQITEKAFSENPGLRDTSNSLQTRHHAFPLFSPFLTSLVPHAPPHLLTTSPQDPHSNIAHLYFNIP